MDIGGIRAATEASWLAIKHFRNAIAPLFFLVVTTFLYLNATRVNRHLLQNLSPTSLGDNGSYLTNTTHLAKAKLSIAEVAFEGSNLRARAEHAIAEYEDRRGRGLANFYDQRIQYQKLTGVTKDIMIHLQNHPQFGDLQSNVKKSLLAKYKGDKVVNTIYRPAASAALLWAVYSGEKIESKITDDISVYSRTGIDQSSSELKTQEFGFSSHFLSGGFEVSPLLGDGEMNEKYKITAQANLDFVDASISIAHGVKTKKTALAITKKLHRNVACTYELNDIEQKAYVNFAKEF